MKRAVGYLIIAFSILTSAIIIMLAQIASRADEIDGTFGNWFGQIPPAVFVLVFIVFCLGLLLLNEKD